MNVHADNGFLGSELFTHKYICRIRPSFVQSFIRSQPKDWSVMDTHQSAIVRPVCDDAIGVFRLVVYCHYCPHSCAMESHVTSQPGTDSAKVYNSGIWVWHAV